MNDNHRTKLSAKRPGHKTKGDESRNPAKLRSQRSTYKEQDVAGHCCRDPEEGSNCIEDLDSDRRKCR